MAAWAVGVALTPTLSRRERGAMAAWAVGVALTPTLSQRERGQFDTACCAGNDGLRASAPGLAGYQPKRPVM